MNNIEKSRFIQPLIKLQDNQKNKEICDNLRQAIKVINAAYQQIDWEDSAFLNRVLSIALKNLETKEVR
jgi:hypothetical protein